MLNTQIKIVFSLENFGSWSASVIIPKGQMLMIGGVDKSNKTLDSIEKVDAKNRVSSLSNISLPLPLAGQ